MEVLWCNDALLWNSLQSWWLKMWTVCAWACLLSQGKRIESVICQWDCESTWRQWFCGFETWIPKSSQYWQSNSQQLSWWWRAAICKMERQHQMKRAQVNHQESSLQKTELDGRNQWQITWQDREGQLASLWFTLWRKQTHHQCSLIIRCKWHIGCHWQEHTIM